MQGEQNSGFDGSTFVNILLLVIFIALLLFGSTDIPDVPIDSTDI